VGNPGFRGKGRGTLARARSFDKASAGEYFVPMRVFRGDVANDPQSLWISLWVPLVRVRQVTQRQGFSFFRSIFERRPISLARQTLRKFFPCQAGRLS
jgi:hypothetical protein